MTTTTEFWVLGQVDDPSVYAVLGVLEAIKAGGSPVSWKEAETVLEPDWEEALRAQQLALGGACYGHKQSPLVLKDGKYLGGIEEFKACVEKEYQYKETISLDLYQNMAVEALRKTLKDRKRTNCYMDIRIGTKGLKRVIFELYPDLCPKAVENFRALCSGERGHKLTYNGSPFHRVVPDGWVQGGDIVTGNGDGGVSIYGDTFPDECFSLKLDKPGILAMANKNGAPHTNASQFFVSLAPLPWLQYKVVGIGRLVKGLSTIREMTALPTVNQRPVEDCIIVNCGVVNLEEDSTTLLGGPSINYHINNNHNSSSSK